MTANVEELTSYERMQQQGLFTDAFPTIRPAGKAMLLPNDTTAMDVQPDIYYPVGETPRFIQKFRRNYCPGVINVHFGLQGQPLPTKEHVYGVHTNTGESAKRTMAAGKVEGIAEYMQSVGERIYHSVKREPLGKSLNRGYELPEECHKPGFEYGAHFGDRRSAKDVIFPRDSEPDRPDDHEQYVRTHGSFDPGEMLKRDYSWPAETYGATFAFGKRDENADQQGVKRCLAFDRDADLSMPTTRIVKNGAEDFREVNNDHLGRSKNYMQGRPPVPPDHAFGKGGTKNKEEGTVETCIRGWDSLASQMPDKDLGKCLVPGRRNISSDPDRMYGVPSIRRDIPKPRTRSVADAQNYGDEVGASALLNPQRFEIMGVPDSAFLLRRPRDELRVLTSAAKVKVDDGEFDSIWERAVALFDDAQELVSLDAFLFVYADFIKDDVAGSNDTLGKPRPR